MSWCVRDADGTAYRSFIVIITSSSSDIVIQSKETENQ